MNKDFTYLDVSIIEKFQNGNQDAFEEVYLKYRSRVFAIAYQFSENQEMANDIVQETFLKVYKYKKNLQHPEALFTWISKIAYALCVDRYKKHKRSADYYINDFEDGYLEERFEDAKQTNAIDQIQMEYAKQIILDSLHEMNSEWQVTGYLRFFEELSIKEIGEIMSVPTGTVLSRLSRIKTLLRSNLEKQNFTKETCFSLFLVPNMIGFYNEFAKSIPSSTLSVEKVNENITIYKQLESGKKFPYLSVTLAATLMLSVGALAMKSGGGLLLLPKQHAEIASINYNKEITKEPLKVAVETTNENYDKILIDGKEELMVQKNGTYVVELYQEEVVIDAQEIVIENIDVDVPIVTHEEMNDKIINMIVVDDLSGIDYAKVELYANDVKKEFHLDASGKITLIRDKSTDYLVVIPDNVGNVLNIKINNYSF